MFYFFSKTLNYLLTPAGWLTTALLLAFLTKKPLRRRGLIGVGLGVFWLFSNPVLTNELALWWEYPVTNEITVVSTRQKASSPADSTPTVAVLLTGGMVNVSKDVPNGRFLLGREADRAGQVLYLYKTGAVRKILISGGSGSLPFGPKSASDEGQMVARFLMVAGVRPGDIVLENRSRNTHENALFSANMLRGQLRTDRCVLVTSASHMRRAVACFRKENVRATPFPGVFMGRRRSFGPGEYILPSEQTFADSYYLVREMVGYGAYWAMGYV